MTKHRVAILADIHGNVDALEAVLLDLKTRTCDQLVFAGDLVMNGPRPAESMQLIRSLNAPGVVGNTDKYVLDTSATADVVAAWARERLSASDLEYLASLPLHQRITPPGGASPSDDLLIVHSTPRDCDDLLILEIPARGTNFRETTPPEKARAMLVGEEANLIVFGHIHYFSSGVVDGQRMASIGSVGNPFDHDHRAAYAIVEWNGENWEIEPYRVPYDYQKVALELEHSGIPFAPTLVRRILEADWFVRPS